jgi:signal transduction histidine kinase
MDINMALNNSIAEQKDMTALAESEVTPETDGADPFMDDSQELLLKAQKDAQLAKAVARQAISRAFQQSEATVKRAEVLARAFDDALQGSVSQIRHEDGDSGSGFVVSGRVKKLLNNRQHPLNAISDMTRSLFNNKTVDAGTRMDFYNLVIRQSKQLRELVDDLVGQQVQKKIEKAIEEAKSDRIASKLAAQQARDEVTKAREEAEKAINEAETARRDAEEAIDIARGWVEEAKREVAAEKKAAAVKVSQAQQQAMSRTTEEVKKAKDEVMAARDAARIAIRHAEAEARRCRQESEDIRNQTRIDVALAQEKAQQEAEKVATIKQQSQIAIDRALAEAARFREEAGTALRESEQAVSRAQEESRQAIEKVEQEKKQIQETVIEAQQQSYQDICEEMNRVKAEAEATRKSACESIKRAQEESRKAKEEAAAVKKDAEEALGRAREEARQAREEAEKTRQTLQEVIVRAQEESRLIKEEAEASILMAGEAMKNARQDIIGMTIGEITRTRQELEAASQDPGAICDSPRRMERPAPEDGKQPGLVDGSYIAAVLHEMRAPLHSISGFAGLMLEDNISDAGTQKEFLSIVVQQSQSLNRLLDDLSGLLTCPAGAAPPAETVPIEKGTVSPHQLVTEAVQSAQGTALQKKNVIILSIPGTLPPIEADGMRIRQVLLNLITNAVKFSPDNAAIIVRAELRDSELLIQVKDRGIGIPPAEISSVFNEYYQAANRGDAAGLGLGLHICKQIVEAHNGRIWAESAEGQGSTFSFTLPVAPAAV